MIWDEKVMIFRGFSCRIGLWHCAHIKRMDTDIISDISDPKKNTRISNSKFCQRSEHIESSDSRDHRLYGHCRKPYTNQPINIWIKQCTKPPKTLILLWRLSKMF
jgi:hypothetical protein